MVDVPKSIENLPNRIGDVFYGRAVLITGGTGFLGKVLLEKLLRTCSGVKTVYLLVRSKKGRSPAERVEDVFASPLFDVLRREQPDAPKKCVAVCGDVCAEELGVAAEDRRRLQDEVDFIFHAAATTRFDESLKFATQMNTRGTKYMLNLALQCKKLKAFIYVSTAYAYPKQKVLYERSYPPPANPHEVLSSVSWIKEDPNGELTKKLLGDCPNTYTFSKALAEALVVEQMGHIPCLIVRPSIVVPIFRDPLPGWCNNLQGPMGLFVGAGKGIIRTMYVSSKSHADFLPADLVINGLLVATWNFMQNKGDNVVNLTSSADYNITWEEIIEIGKDVVLNEVPFNGIVWYPGGSMKKSKLAHNIAFFLFQIIPALLIDVLLFCLGYKPILLQIQKRIQKGSEMFEYYTTRAWNFSNEHVHDVRERMNAKEKLIYKIDGEGVDIRAYFINCIRCVRLTILKETDDMLPAAKRNLKIMWAVDLLLKSVLALLSIYYMYKWIVGPLFHI